MKFKYRILFSIIFFNYFICQNFNYAKQDWYILNKIGSINAIAEDNFNIYFALDNGIVKYEKITENFQFDYEFSINLNVKNIKHMIYDDYRDYFWIVHSEGINFKSSVSTIWRELLLTNTGIFSINEIDDLGYSSEYIWIKSMDNLYSFDPFTAKLVYWEESKNEVELINWGYSKYGSAGDKIDMSSFSIAGDWLVGLNRIHSIKNNNELNPTIFMKDKERNLWFGTEEGFLLKGWAYSKRLEILRIGLPFNNVTISYFDNYGNWWFADSQFKRVGMNYNASNMPFIASWKEEENLWKYYNSNESGIIDNLDINSIKRVGSIIYFGTMSGLLYLDLFDSEWNKITASNGLYDSAIWDILEFKNSIYLATANGLNEVSIINHSIVPDNERKFDFLSHVSIYDLESDSNYFYLATDMGLFKMDWNNLNHQLITNKKFKKIVLESNNIFGLNEDLWLIDFESKHEKQIMVDIHDFDVCGSYVWASKKSKAKILNLITNFDLDYNYLDGIPGNKIYGIECDEDWVWFLTNDGVAFYRWGNYHNEN